MKTNSLRRVLALVLAFAICFGLMAFTASAEELPANLMRNCGNPRDVFDDPNLRNHEYPFWGQYSLQRGWVNKIVFHDNLDEAPTRHLLDFSARNDRSVIGWYNDGVLHVAADGKIYLPVNSSYMFAYFNHLHELDFNNSVDTSFVKNMSHMFDDCCKLESLDVSFFDTSKVTDMRNMFFLCRRVPELNVTGFDTSKVTDMRKMFGYCETIDSLDLSGFNTAKVKDMGFMFYCDKNLTALDLSSFDTSSNKCMTSMFYNCENLESLNISSFDTSKVYAMPFCFAGCKNLQDLDVTHFDVAKVQQAGMFMDRGRQINGQPWRAFFKHSPVQW